MKLPMTRGIVKTPPVQHSCPRCGQSQGHSTGDGNGTKSQENPDLPLMPIGGTVSVCLETITLSRPGVLTSSPSKLADLTVAESDVTVAE